MTTYYYTKTRTGRSVSGGTNYRFRVYKLTQKGMKDMGDFKINTASYCGDYGEVAQFLHKKEGYVLSDRGYRIKRKDVHIKSL